MVYLGTVVQIGGHLLLRSSSFHNHLCSQCTDHLLLNPSSALLHNSLRHYLHIHMHHSQQLCSPHSRSLTWLHLNHLNTLRSFIASSKILVIRIKHKEEWDNHTLYHQ